MYEGMKKIYSFFLFLLVLAVAPPAAKASDILVGLGTEVTALDQLTEGTRIVLYCSGRGGYVKSIGDYKIGLRQLETSTPASGYFLWTVTNLQTTDTGVTFRLKDADGGFMSNFDGSRIATTSPESTAGVFTATAGTESGFWSITDARGIYFNGNAVASGGENFVGWHEAGGSSNYKIYLPEVEDMRTISSTFFCMDKSVRSTVRTADGRDLVITTATLVGDTVQMPEHEALLYYSLEEYEDPDGELLPAGVPYVAGPDSPDELYFVLYFRPWLTVTLNCVTATDARVFFTKTVRVPVGGILPLPTQKEVGRGYWLTSTEYENYVVTEDETITLVYEEGDALPVRTTTIVDGAFAPGTRFYNLRLNGRYVFAGSSDPQVKVTSSLPDDDDSYRWAFVKGGKDGSVMVYNKLWGAGVAMSATGSDNATPILMAEPSDGANAVFEVKDNGDGFCLVYVDTPHASMNLFGNGAELKLWNSSYSLTDGNNRFEFVELPLEGDITGIGAVQGAERAAGGAVYDLGGRRVAQPRRGVYIRGRRKVFVK